MSVFGIARDYGSPRTDNVRWAVATASDWLSFVKFNDLAVIDICAECPLCSLDVGREGITGQLNPICQPI